MRAPACGSHRCSKSVRDNSGDRPRTRPGNGRISRGEATTCRASVSDRDDDKLAPGSNREHRVLTAGVQRLNASGCIPGALDLFGVLTAAAPTSTIVVNATSLPIDVNRQNATGSGCHQHEVEYQLSLAVRLGYLELEPHRELAALCIETSKVLAGLIRALRR